MRLAIATGALVAAALLAVACSGDSAAPTGPTAVPSFAKAPGTLLDPTLQTNFELKCPKNHPFVYDLSLLRPIECGIFVGTISTSVPFISSFSWAVSPDPSSGPACSGIENLTGVYKCRSAEITVTQSPLP